MRREFRTFLNVFGPAAVLSLAILLLWGREAHAPALAQAQTEEELEDEREAMDSNVDSISVEDAIAEFLGHKKKGSLGPTDLACFDKYEVQGGENLTRIARDRSRALKIKAKMIGPMGLISQLTLLNQKRIKDLHYIYPGTELLLPPLLSSKIHTPECRHYKIPKYRKIASVKKYKCEDPGHSALKKRVLELEREVQRLQADRPVAGGISSAGQAPGPSIVEE